MVAEPPDHSNRRLYLLAGATFALLAAIWTDASPLLRGPAPFPPEWQWAARDHVGGRISGLAVASTSGLLALVLVSASAAVRRRARGAAALLVGSATLLGAGLQLGLLDLEDGPGGASELMRRTVDTGFTGYFSAALSPAARDPVELIDRYPEWIPAFRQHAPHAATNPPGPILYFRAIEGLCRASPEIREPLVALAVRAGAGPAPAEISARAVMASALLAPLLLLLAGAAVSIPLYALALAAGAERLAAARLAIVWNTLPSVSLMVPEIDQLLAWWVAAASALLAIALQTRRFWAVAGLASGVCAGLAALVSYGAVVFQIIGFGAAFALTRPAWARLSRALAWAACGALLVLFGLLALGYEPIAALTASLASHFGEYTLKRSYWTWLVFNPWDLAVFLGLPVALLAGARAWDAVVQWRRAPDRAWACPATRLALLNTAGFLALWASGLVRGEVGRSWLPILPFLLLASLLRPGATASRSALPGALESGVLVALLLASSWVLRASWHLP